MVCNTKREVLQFFRQDDGFVMYWMYRIYIHALYDMFEIFPFVKKIALSKFGRRLPFSRLQTGSGLLDRQFILSNQILYALAKEKIPVICPPVLSFVHNHGKVVFSTWSKYYDMENITVAFIDKDRNFISERKIKVISEGDFIKSCSLWKWIWVPGWVRITGLKGERNLKKPDKAKILIVKTTHHQGDSVSLVKNMERKTENIPSENFQIKFQPSKEVLHIAKAVIEKMGEYHVLGIRRGDIERRRFISNSLLENILERNIEKGARLYIMSNEGDKTHFDFLKADYRVYQYFDFPELVEIATGKNADNYMLFTVERVLFRSAKIGLAPCIEDNNMLFENIRTRYLSFIWELSI